MIKFSLSVTCLLVLATLPSHASPRPDLPAGALLPPRRDPFGIDAVEELERQRKIEGCRLVKVESLEVYPSQTKQSELEKPVRYVYTCP